MNNSVMFLKERIANGNYSPLMKEIDFNNVITYNPMNALKMSNARIGRLITDNSITFIAENDIKEKKKIKVFYIPDNEFSFFAKNFYTDEVDKVSINKEINSILDDLFKGLLFNRETAPDNYDADFWKFDVEYIIGDLVLNSKCIKQKDDTEKQYDIMMLPISVAYVRNKNK